MDKSSSRKRLIVYLALVFAITYLLEFLVIVPLATNPDYSTQATALVSIVMLLPAICVVITRLVTKEGFRDMWLRLNLKKRWRYYLIAWFAPTVLIIIGALVYFAIFPQNFDGNFTVLREGLAAQGAELPEGQAGLIMALQIAQSALIAPALNIVFCLGEELGWRGYMMPKLAASGVKAAPAVLIGGVIWGLWHAPLTWGIGHNYGFGYAGYPWAGIAAMCGFCVIGGALFTWLSYKTHSCIPAALAHGALNGGAAFGIYLTKAEAYNPFVGPSPTGIIGACAFIITAVVVTVMMSRDEKRGELIYEPAVEGELVAASAPAPIPTGFTEADYRAGGGDGSAGKTE